MAKWFGQATEEEAGKAVEAKFGQLEETLKVQNEAFSKQGEVLNTLAESVKLMNKRYADEEAARIKAENDRKAAEARAAKEGITPEARFERLAEDPDGYIREQTLNTTRLAMITSAKQLRQEILGEKEYYVGEFKTQVDNMIAAEPNLQNQNNPNFINNCYKIVLADNLERINKGELRRNAALHSFSDGDKSGNRSTDSNAKPTVEYRDQNGANVNKAKYAAAQLGLTDDDIIEAAKAGVIHGLEVVA